jgi:hypothetical protein
MRLTTPPAGNETALSGSKSTPLFTHHVLERTSERRSIALVCGGAHLIRVPLHQHEISPGLSKPPLSVAIAPLWVENRLTMRKANDRRRV